MNVYYKLENFYQNHRRYVKSRSPAQLRGTYDPDIDKVADCAPVYRMKHLFEYQRKNVNGDALKPDDVAVPCGMLAKSFFNDTYKMKYSNGTKVNINENGIAWSADIYYRYKNIENPPEGKTW